MRHLRDFVLTVGVLAALGAAAGLLWSVVSPRTPYVITASGPRLTDPMTQALIAADGWFALITGVAGLACGVTAYLLARRGRPVALLAGLAAGGLLAGRLALAVGTSLDSATVQAAAPGSAAVGSTVGVLTVTAAGVLLCWPLVSVAVFGILESADGYRDSPLREPYAGEETPSGTPPPPESTAFYGPAFPPPGPGAAGPSTGQGTPGPPASPGAPGPSASPGAAGPPPPPV
ncbi:hypothetical protein [Sphaerisporangium aureirubrum]|uniref:DUF2567 domain-containing protein n=1 Tax=Sphaerisporangium aureirubrum TaxID=1544736 RepID=A0ABW1NUX6_9ACTN